MFTCGDFYNHISHCYFDLKKRLFPPLTLLFLLLSFAGPSFAGSVNYTYDVLGRLKTVTYSNGVVITYSYDAAGNRTSAVTTGA